MAKDELFQLVIRCNKMALCSPIQDKHLRSLPHAEEPYYAFLYYLARELKPQVIVELGVYKGVGLAHLAAGGTSAVVFGVDNHEHDWGKAITPYPYIWLSVKDSLTWLREYSNYGDESIDILHIDTEHTYQQVKEEFELALPLMASPGVICIDDIHYNEEMGNVWRSLKGRKIELNSLHVTGYGVILV